MSYGVIVTRVKSSDFIPHIMKSNRSILSWNMTRSSLCSCCCLRKDPCKKYCVEKGGRLGAGQ